MPEREDSFLPLITVITVTYNSAEFVRQTIESVLGQQYPHFEYIIGDDSSTDETWDIINQYKDPRIKTYRNETNLREYPNRNKALQMASGKYLLFIDGDDVIYPHALAVFVSYAKKFQDCSMYFCRHWDHRILYPYKIAPVDMYRFEYMDEGIVGGNFTRVFFNTDILKAAGLPVHVATGDTYIQLRLAQKYPALVIPDGLSWWRRRTGNATGKFFSNERGSAETIGYRLQFLNSKDCPLSPEEIEWAKNNIYGGFLRLLVRLFFRGEW
ncbi:MAG TPA: glycosyltransferase family 2 protein, partial [Chitinophagaceae bacterium]|nr:glycosyltransferase family 2 protein [Chitinophagaceae bacterium]